MKHGAPGPSTSLAAFAPQQNGKMLGRFRGRRKAPKELVARLDSTEARLECLVSIGARESLTWVSATKKATTCFERREDKAYATVTEPQKTKHKAH